MSSSSSSSSSGSSSSSSGSLYNFLVISLVDHTEESLKKNIYLLICVSSNSSRLGYN